ncbi:MAG: hypothetical protein QOE19_2455 [Actinomycetota bacterium]|nr:hypothetical protein [Actinomycetota bacterium]
MSVVSPVALGFATAACKAGIPTAVTVHSLWPALGPVLPVAAAVLGLRGRPLAWSAVSDVAAQRVQKALGGRGSVMVLPNAVDVDWWRAASPRPPKDQEVTVVSVLRMSARKRPLPLLRMLTEVRRVVPSTISLRLVLVGDGPQRKAIERQVRRDAMGSWVGLPGRLGRAQVREVLAGADIYVAPARLESFGIAALEARSVGLPIVAKRSGGVSSFVRSGEEGLLTGRDRDMTRCIAELVASPQLRAAMTAHNRSHPPELGWSATMITTGALYSRAALLAGGAGVAVEPSTQTDPRPAVAQ